MAPTQHSRIASYDLWTKRIGQATHHPPHLPCLSLLLVFLSCTSRHGSSLCNHMVLKRLRNSSDEEGATVCTVAYWNDEDRRRCMQDAGGWCGLMRGPISGYPYGYSHLKMCTCIPSTTWSCAVFYRPPTTTMIERILFRLFCSVKASTHNKSNVM